MQYMNYNDLKEGMTVYVDDGFDCMPAGPHTVHGDGTDFYLHCDEGYHNLDGQCEEDDIMIGISSTSFENLD